MPGIVESQVQDGSGSGLMLHGVVGRAAPTLLPVTLMLGGWSQGGSHTSHLQ